jgi:oxygen-dependent protoporphyrinogen oxidase
VLRAFANSQSASRGEGAFRSLRGGMGELVKVLLDRLPDGSTWLASPVTTITRAGSQWIVSTAANAFTAHAVILAAPAHACARWLRSTSPEIARLCAQVPYVSTASVALAWPREDVPNPLAGTGFVVARQHSQLRITACSWVTSKWPGRAPDEMALFRAFLGGTHDRGVAQLPDDELIQIAVDDVRSVHGITTSPVFSRAHKWIDAGAQHEVGHGERIATIDRLLADEPGLYVAGSGFRAIGVPDCIVDGQRAASAAADYVKMQQ